MMTLNVYRASPDKELPPARCYVGGAAKVSNYLSELGSLEGYTVYNSDTDVELPAMDWLLEHSTLGVPAAAHDLRERVVRELETEIADRRTAQSRTPKGFSGTMERVELAREIAALSRALAIVRAHLPAPSALPSEYGSECYDGLRLRKGEG